MTTYALSWSYCFFYTLLANRPILRYGPGKSRKLNFAAIIHDENSCEEQGPTKEEEHEKFRKDFWIGADGDELDVGGL